MKRRAAAVGVALLVLAASSWATGPANFRGPTSGSRFGAGQVPPQAHAPTHLSTGNDAIDTCLGATALLDGLDGLVTKPLAGEEELFLKGDCTWSTVSGSSAELLFPVTFVDIPFGTVPSVTLDDMAGWNLRFNRDNQGVHFNFILTDKVNLSFDPRIRFDIYQFTTTGIGTDDDVLFEAEVKYLAVGANTGDAIDETIPVVATWPLDPSVLANVGQRQTVSIELDRTLILPTDSIFVNVFRRGTDPLDTFNGNVLISVNGGLEFGS